MTHSSTIKISSLVSLLLIFIILLAFSLFKYLRQRQQVPATLPDDEQPPAIQGNVTSHDNIIPINNINLPQAELLELICGISNESSNAPIIRGITPDREFRNIPLLEINEITVVPASSLENYDKLSQIVANSIPDNSYQSLNNHEKTIMNIAKKHIESIKATLNIQDKECCRIFHNRITTAAILEHIFNKSQSLTPNISIIHELVNHYNPAGGQRCYMPLKFLKLVFKECQEIDTSKATTKDIVITFKRAKTTKSLACTINTNIIIPYKGKNEKLSCKLDFTITSSDSQNFSCVCYENISSILFIPSRMNIDITSPSSTNNSCIANADSARLTTHTLVKHGNYYCTQLTYSFPNLQAPLLIDIENIYPILDDVPPAIQTTSPSSAATPYDDIIPTNSNIKMPQAELLELMCGISNESSNAPIIRGITPDREFRNIPLLEINEITVVPASSLENYDKLSQIVANSIPDNSYQSLNNHEKTIMNIAKKHIESIKATLNIQDKECCRIFHNRITTAAILEHIFNKSQSLTPNISIIHELVNHYNPAGGQRCYMPLKFLKLVFKECQEIDTSKATTKDIVITFKRAKTTKSLACTINTNIIIPYKGKNEKLSCKLDFTITSSDSQNFSCVCYENISSILFIPSRMNIDITSPSSTNNSCIANADSARLTTHTLVKHGNYYCTQLTYSFPNLQAPLLIDIENIYPILDDVPPAIQTTSPSSAATPYDDIIPTNSNIKMPQAELLELMCGISNESLNAPIIRDITPDREFRNIPLLKINEIVVVPAPSLKNYGKLSQIVANSIPDNSYQSLNNHEKAIMNIAKNHIESIKATLNIQDKECCRIFHNRITTAAILEHIFNKSQSLIPNISIIHALVNHYNLEEGCCAMPLKFLKLVFKEHQEIDMSKATTKDIIITFKRAETTKSLACTSNTNIIIPYKGKNEKLLCKLDFTIISPDPQNFSEVHYKSIFFELHVPDRIKTHIPFPPPHASCSLTDLVRLIGCAPDVHVDNNHYTQFIYSFPNLKAPLLTSKQSFNAVCGFAGTSVENCSHATQQHC